MDAGGNSWLYIGILDDYSTNNEELDYIYLTRPFRRKILPSEYKNNETENIPFLDRFYEIDVDSLMLRYSDIKSLGIKKISQQSFE